MPNDGAGSTDMTLTVNVTSLSSALNAAVRFCGANVSRRCGLLVPAAGTNVTGDSAAPVVSTTSNVLPSGHVRCEQSAPAQPNRMGDCRPVCW